MKAAFISGKKGFDLFFTINRRVILTLLGAFIFLGLSACKPTLLPNTNLKDNKENRSLYKFMLQYKGAVEKRNSEAVMALVSQDYFEDNGNLIQEDDYGYDGLKERLNNRFGHLKAIKLDLFIQDVAEGDNKIFVVYRYQQRTLVTLPAGESWVSHNDVARLTLRKKGDDFKDGFEVLSGL